MNFTPTPSRLGSAAVLLMMAAAVRAATLSPQGTNLTVTSTNLQVSFRRADIVGIVNRLSGESYLRNPSSNQQLNLALTQPPSQPLNAAGSWTVNAAGTSASLIFSDSNRKVSIAVAADPASQEIVLSLDGKAPQ